MPRGAVDVFARRGLCNLDLYLLENDAAFASVKVI